MKTLSELLDEDLVECELCGHELLLDEVEEHHNLRHPGEE